MSTTITKPERPATPRQVLAWGLWDWGSSAFHAVVLAFVFNRYLTDAVGDDLPGDIPPATWLGWALGLAGFVIAITAPVSGQRFDAAGRRKQSLAVLTGFCVLSIAAMFFVRDSPTYFWVGLFLLASASVSAELAQVPYNALLSQVSTSKTVGRVGGFGWAMGYFGGIVLLLICYVGFIAGEGETRGLFAVATTDGLYIRLAMLVCAVWFALFALPVLFAVPEPKIAPTADPGAAQAGILESYRVLWRDVRDLWHADRRTVYFLIASAIYRDGLAGIFTFGAILAVSVYGISDADVLLFGIGANVAAAIGAVVAGRFDDHSGPKAVIVGSLIALLGTGMVLLVVDGPTMFWIFGLLLTLFVGPAQSAGRTFLTRVAPPGREGQIFGLYATTGRTVSFLAPTLFAFFVLWFGSERAGIAGLMIILAIGLVAMLFVRDAKAPEPAAA